MKRSDNIGIVPSVTFVDNKVIFIRNDYFQRG